MSNMKNKLQREVDVLDYTRLLLTWMGSSPEKRKGLKFEELSDAVGLLNRKPKTGPLQDAIKNTLITKEKSDSYRLPKPDVIEYMIKKWNAEEQHKEVIFQRPPLYIQMKSPDQT